MRKITQLVGRLAEMPLNNRIMHCLVFLGIPLLIWQAVDVAGEIRHNLLAGTAYLWLRGAISLGESAGTALVAALIEHAIFKGLKGRTAG